jgi:L-asparaginase/Glu-tRNA(Gln) amidotransferase subunit D
MVKLYVIVPDIASGVAFNEVLNNNGISTEWKYYKIAPRVINNGISKSKEVAADLNKVFSTFKNKTQSVVIACNTLQLWLPKVKEKYKKNIKIYTTFEACEWKFAKEKKKPIWLGTSPLVRETSKFPTFLSIGQIEAQNIVQEIIWRVKMMEGDDFATAPIEIRNDSSLSKSEQKKKIDLLRDSVLDSLKRAGVKHAILGCTELPMVFTKKKMNGIELVDPADVTAQYIKAQSVALVFAGGTISSLPNKVGALVGGKVFNLLEKLIETLPGSFSNFNITKAQIAYSGLSENMMESDHKKLITSVSELVDNGVSKVVITHGTDAMEQTAKILSKSLEKKLSRKNIPVLLTGANLHVEDKNTDAWDNLRFALNAEGLPGGVYIAFANKIIKGSLSVKERFNDKSMRYAQLDNKEYQNDLLKSNQEVQKQIELINKKLVTPKKHGLVIHYPVNIIRKNHDSFLKKIEKKNVKAVLFTLYHSSTANTKDKDASVVKLIQKLTKRGIVCFGATENFEPTDMDMYETSYMLRKVGLVTLNNMKLPVALHKLNILYTMNPNYSNKEIVNFMQTSIVGEIDEKLVKKNK